MIEFKLPDVGEGMHEAEIVRWLVKPGDMVRLDQPILEIQTDKALVEIPAPSAGKIVELKFAEGKMAQLGDVLVLIEPEGAKPAPASSASSLPKTTETQAQFAPQAATVGAASTAPGGTGAISVAPVTSRVRAAPAVRKLALELDVDLSQVRPSSPDGRVLMQDVKAFAEHKAKVGSNGTASTAHETEPVAALKAEVALANETRPAMPPIEPPPMKEASTAPPAPARQPFIVQRKAGQPATEEEERRPLVGLRRRIAERMELAWRTIPHVTSFDEIDATELIALRQKLKPFAEKRGLNLTYLPFIVKVVTATLKEFPNFNASLDDKTRELIYKRYYHIGMATATPDGLLVPVLRHADQLTTLELSAEIARLSEGARKRSLTAPELGGSTFTITNFGSYGEAVGTPIINPPEVAILGVGRIQEKWVVQNGEGVVQQRMPICVSFDHRVIDGADSGAFMGRLKELLENPALLLLDC